METIDEIWDGDLFDRRKEAEDITGYLESVVSRPSLREDGHAHVLAIDTEYGHGKTYFLRRLARHMRTDHAVAFVDAWTDDLADEPMVALAATLEEALEPWIEKSDRVQRGLTKFKAKAGKVAKIVGIGLAKRGIGLLITQTGADALGDELSKANDVDKDLRKDALKGAGKDVVDGVSNAFGGITTSTMDERITRFREGKAAIRDMKSGLTEIVEALTEAGMKLPITIIVDELDRCRPTYAIKVLEEIKHLFDVPGVAFVLGLHGQQLAHSVTAAYGVGFDGNAYLRRFFNRRYALKPAGLTPLISKLITDLAIPEGRFMYPEMRKRGASGQPFAVPLSDFISNYMISYGLPARDAFELMEMLQTCAALTAPHPLLLAYLLPLIISHIRGSSDLFPVAKQPAQMVFVHYSGGQQGQWLETGLPEMATKLSTYAAMQDREFTNAINNNANNNPALDQVRLIRFSNLPSDTLANPARYVDLLRSVERFS